MTRNPIVREVSDFVLPAILLFGLYVQFHGDFSPGGGFQAGVLVGAGVWVYALVHGLDRTQRIIPPAVVRTGVSLGLLLYIGVGFACLVMGENFLDYDALAAHHGGGAHAAEAAGDGHGAAAGGGHGAAAEGGGAHGAGDTPNPHGQHIGILLIELGVGITVASVMVTVFYGYAARRGAHRMARGE